MFGLDYYLSYPWEINKDTSKVILENDGMYVREKVESNVQYMECNSKDFYIRM